jgi:hypothetical protein
MKDAEAYDPLTEEMKKNATENKAVCLPGQVLCLTSENMRQEEKRNIKNKEDDRKKSVTNSLLSLKDTEISSQFEKMNDIPGFNLYSVSIPGGVYKEVLRYPDKILPDSRRGRSLSLSQQKMHDAMINLQYDR